jgi:hypothetical protein
MFTDEMQKASDQHQKQQQEQQQKIKRNGWLILLVLFCFLAYGCVDLLTVSDGELAEREAQVSIEAAEKLEDLREADEQAALAHATAKQQTVESEPQKEVVNTQSEYQDEEWIYSCSIYMKDLAVQNKYLETSLTNQDLNSIKIYSDNIYALTNSAMDINDKYTVSPELEIAKKEYDLYLVSANWVAFHYYMGADSAINGNYNDASEYFTLGIDSSKTAITHLNNFNSEMEDYIE